MPPKSLLYDWPLQRSRYFTLSFPPTPNLLPVFQTLPSNGMKLFLATFGDKWLIDLILKQIHMEVQIVDQSAKIQIHSFFCVFQNIWYFPILIMRRELERKWDPREDQVLFGLVLWEDWSGLAPFIFVHFEIFLSCETSPQVPGELAQEP